MSGGYNYGAYAPNSNAWYQRQSPFPRSGSASYRGNLEEHRGAPWQSFEDRVVPIPVSVPGLPVHSQSPVQQIPILGNPRAREIQPIPLRIIVRPPSGLQNQPNIFPVEDNSRLIQDEQQAVLKKLKKEIYNPGPKNLLRRLSLYYRDDPKNVYGQKEKLKEDDDAMRCAVCLEDFEPREKVMLTPCNHMFHEECIVPWVKSHAQCPVCRFSLKEKNRASDDNNITANITAASDDELIARELMSVIRAMEDSFAWNNAAR